MEKEFIKNIREKFQSHKERLNLMYLMIEEIRLEQMKIQQKEVSRAETLEYFMDEVNEICTIMKIKDIKEVFKG